MVDLLSMGVASALSIGLGLLLGVLADDRWHSAPLWTFIGLGVGVVCAIASTWRQARKYL
jgi:F0F1-type ATP synthase assembly protein I